MKVFPGRGEEETEIHALKKRIEDLEVKNTEIEHMKMMSECAFQLRIDDLETELAECKSSQKGIRVVKKATDEYKTQLAELDADDRLNEIETALKKIAKETYLYKDNDIRPRHFDANLKAELDARVEIARKALEVTE